MNPPTNTKPEILWLVSVDFNPPVHVHDGSDPALTFQDTTYTGIGSVLKHGWEFRRYMENGISQTRLSISVPLRYGLMPILLRQYINRKITITCYDAKDCHKTVLGEQAIVRNWRLSWNPLCITFQAVGLLEAVLAEQYPYNPGESTESTESNVKPKLWIRLRRRVLTLIEGEESHRRPLYWSHVDQQERHPGDMGFSQTRQANSPLYRWWLEYRWVNMDNPAPGPKLAPMHIYWQEFKYRLRSLIHPEWRWAFKTRRGKHLLRRILRWLSGQL